MKNINDFIDEYGAICHKHKDSNEWQRGDSARETGTYFCYLGEWTNLKFTYSVLNNVFIRAFKVSTSLASSDTSLCRHNYSNEAWHCDPKEFSRDQWQALACAAAIHNKSYLKNALWWEQKNHFFTAQNGDLITYEYNLYIRMFRLWYLWPLLLILDLGLVVNAIIRVIKNRRDSDDVGDCINITSMIYVATQVLPTPTNWLARMIYKTFHPGIQKAWDWYYRHPENPPMNEVWRPIITKYFT